MKKILILSAAFFFAGIGTAAAANRPVKTKPHLDDSVQRVTIDGMDCLVWRDVVNKNSNDAYAYSGLTCDWSMKERR